MNMLPFVLCLLLFVLASPTAASPAAPSPTAPLPTAPSPTAPSPVPLVLVKLLSQTPASQPKIQENLKAMLVNDENKVKYEGIPRGNASREFFLLNNLRPGMVVFFPVSTLAAVTFARDRADFPSKELSQILDDLGVNRNSMQGKALRDTFNICKTAPRRTEKRLCVTSLESMVTFVVSVLGSDHLRVYHSQIPDYSTTELKVLSAELVAKKAISCHKLQFPYSVYLCHFFPQTKTYRVQLGATEATLMIMCHEDTSDWQPDHIAFKVLGVKAGQKTICHTNKVDTLIWGLPL